ncbi:hypothetical protein [Paenibacillus periandrae]|uniref:hypothetical protein n=1 Tax=Paenibacillus periandrae TaxID=1761741 RepID=UPI001F091947|nr:hypothetical protein [Paenibacillus periandrae]
MEKFKFEIGERVTFFWNFTGHSLEAKDATAKEIEDAGVWFEFDGEDDESFVAYEEMHLFLRSSGGAPEGTHALSVNQITEAHFDKNFTPEQMRKLIESLKL